MKKREKIKLYIRSKIYKIIIWYSSVVLGIQLIGVSQNLFNHKAFNEYEEIVSDFGEFLKENGIEEPKEIFDYFCYALWEGYLSKDHEFSFSYFANYFIRIQELAVS